MAENVYLFKIEKSRVYYFDDVNVLNTFISEFTSKDFNITKTTGDKYYIKRRKIDPTDGDDISNYKDYLMIEMKRKILNKTYVFNNTYLLMFNKEDENLLNAIYNKLTEQQLKEG
jgi:hypothetical protein